MDFRINSIYAHRNGFFYECVGLTSYDEPIFREIGKTPKDRQEEYWTFTAHNVGFTSEGRIFWDYSSDGRFEEG